jgi:hypothetical protein
VYSRLKLCSILINADKQPLKIKIKYNTLLFLFSKSLKVGFLLPKKAVRAIRFILSKKAIWMIR